MLFLRNRKVKLCVYARYFCINMPKSEKKCSCNLKSVSWGCDLKPIRVTNDKNNRNRPAPCTILSKQSQVYQMQMTIYLFFMRLGWYSGWIGFNTYITIKIKHTLNLHKSDAGKQKDIFPWAHQYAVTEDCNKALPSPSYSSWEEVVPEPLSLLGFPNELYLKWG